LKRLDRFAPVLPLFHVAPSGRHLVPRSSLEALLTAIAERWNGSQRLRLRVSSLEPMDCSPAIVDLVASCECLAPHFHLPLQHASDRVLRAMRRPYTSAQYFELVDDIRQRMPHASIGSDIIVGFPGESGDDFARLESYLHRSPLTHLHVFPYSDRPGTAASAMTGRIPGPIVRERAKAVRDVSERLAVRFRDSQLGTVRRALTLEDGLLAVTDNYLKVRIPSGRARNEWVRVRITGTAQSGTMAGTVVEGDSASL
jgi:threonylcarbamoyladenosine tRNA methylthiotransferase MtaB